jgi:hypothetical protein
MRKLNKWILSGLLSAKLFSWSIGITLRNCGLNLVKKVTNNQFWKPTQKKFINKVSTLLKSQKMMKF